MPDLARKTVSASEVAALFGESSYSTRWLLWQAFSGNQIPTPEDERMREGRRMQPLIIERAAQELSLAVEPNESDTYVSRGPLGCTRDGVIVNPSRGPGAIETKACFDYRVWMERWKGGALVPREYEIQLQAQLYVGDGHQPFTWGVIVAWVGAHQYYFLRDSQPHLWKVMESEATTFLDDVANRREPDPLGQIIELPLLAQLYPTVTGKVLDWREQDGADAYVPKVRTYIDSKATENTHKKVADSIRAEFIGILRDHETLLLPEGARVSLSTDRRNARRIDVWIPEER